MKVKLHSEIEGGQPGDEVDVPDERGKWLIERGYASSTERVDLSTTAPDLSGEEIERKAGEETGQGEREWTPPAPEPVEAAPNVPGIDSPEGQAQGADVSVEGSPVDPEREDVVKDEQAAQAPGDAAGISDEVTVERGEQPAEPSAEDAGPAKRRKGGEA
jgi:hypothetical protein